MIYESPILVSLKKNRVYYRGAIYQKVFSSSMQKKPAVAKELHMHILLLWHFEKVSAFKSYANKLVQKNWVIVSSQPIRLDRIPSGFLELAPLSFTQKVNSRG